MARRLFTCLGALGFYAIAATSSFAQIINTSDIDAICRSMKWLRLFEQDFRFDRWSICRD